MEIDSIQQEEYSRLDPIIRLLLASIEQLQSYQSLNVNVNVNNQDGADNEFNQRILLTHKTQCQLFQQLRIALSLGTSMDDDDEESSSTSKHQAIKLNVLHQMQKYILLPLILTLHRPPPNGANEIRMNAHRRCIEEAALSLKVFIDILHHTNNGNAERIRNDDMKQLEFTRANVILDTDLRLKSIVGVTESLTSLTQTAPMRNDVNLDKGEECMQALLSCIEALCTRPTFHVKDQLETQGDDVEFITAIQKSMNGQLLFQIAQCCLSVFDSPENGSGDGGPMKKTDLGQLDIKGNVSLKVHALHSVEVLLHMGWWDITNHGQEQEDESKTMTGLWRSMFPGVFKVSSTCVGYHRVFD